MNTTENTEKPTKKSAKKPCEDARNEPKPCVLCEIVVPELQEEIARLKNKIRKLYIEEA